MQSSSRQASDNRNSRRRRGPPQINVILPHWHKYLTALTLFISRPISLHHPQICQVSHLQPSKVFFLMPYDKNGLLVSGKSALIIGATGQTGRHLLQNLLISPHFTRVGEYGRRLTPAEHIINGKDKLEQKAIDFEKLQESGLKQGNWDVVFITYVAI